MLPICINYARLALLSPPGVGHNTGTRSLRAPATPRTTNALLKCRKRRLGPPETLRLCAPYTVHYRAVTNCEHSGRLM
ncbi:unnamed protein product, partial [Brenthis ino]